MKVLNNFSGMTDARLIKKHAEMLASLRHLLESDEELGGGSPLEGFYDRLEDIERELVSRGLMSDREKQSA